MEGLVVHHALDCGQLGFSQTWVPVSVYLVFKFECEVGHVMMCQPFYELRWRYALGAFRVASGIQVPPGRVHRILGKADINLVILVHLRNV